MSLNVSSFSASEAFPSSAWLPLHEHPSLLQDDEMFSIRLSFCNFSSYFNDSSLEKMMGETAVDEQESLGEYAGLKGSSEDGFFNGQNVFGELGLTEEGFADEKDIFKEVFSDHPAMISDPILPYISQGANESVNQTCTSKTLGIENSANIIAVKGTESSTSVEPIRCTEELGIQSKTESEKDSVQLMPKVQHCIFPFIKVRRYNKDEREIRIWRYKDKRRKRNFLKKVEYCCRKVLADSRPRVRGRFAKSLSGMK